MRKGLISKQHLLRLITIVDLQKLPILYFKTTLVKTHHIQTSHHSPLTHFKTTLVKTHRLCCGLMNYTTNNFKTTLVKTHRLGWTMYRADDNFKTTLVKTHQIIEESCHSEIYRTFQNNTC